MYNLLVCLTKSLYAVKVAGTGEEKDNTKTKLRVVLCNRHRIHSPLVNPLAPICEVHSRR